MHREDKIYKQHYACFHCRKAFKKVNIQEVPDHLVKIDERGRVVHCPQCGKRMPEVGFDFKAPKKHDTKGWKEAETRLKESFAHALRNSRIVNVKNRRTRNRFIEELDKRRGSRYSQPGSEKQPKR